MYVDGMTPEVPVAEFKKPDKTNPVQVFFDFQTKGVSNAQATEFLKERIFDQIRTSNLFSDISEEPVSNHAILSITLNNIVLTDDVYSKAFLTGLTFGLAGSQVSDGYICMASYMADVAAKPVIKEARHAIHTTLGAAAAPGQVIKTEGLEEAVTIMTRQIISNVLFQLSNDPDFK